MPSVRAAATNHQCMFSQPTTIPHGSQIDFTRLAALTQSASWHLPTLFSNSDGFGRSSSMSHTLSDSEIARGVAAGDRVALEAAFNQFGGAVKSLGQRVIRNEALAEDVVQETFLAFWKSSESFKPDRGSLRTYLLTIAHRRAVDIVRSEEARTRREQVPPDPTHFDLEDEIITRSVSEEVRNALSALAPDERDAITMAYLGGHSYVEAARRLGAPEGTVKSRIRSGMKKLASSLEGVAP